MKKHRKTNEWNESELRQLYDLVEAGVSYPEIALELGRKSASCQKKFKSMDWSFLIKEPGQWADKGDNNDKKRTTLPEQKFVELIMELARYNPARLCMVSKAALLEKLQPALPDGFKESDLPVSFAELMHLAKIKMDEMGLKYPAEKSFGPGLYLVVSDSHGKYTTKRMFDLLRVINKYLKPKKIIHLGHAYDDDSDMSYLWRQFPNLVVLGMNSELCSLGGEVEQYDVVREKIMLGNLLLTNQYVIADYNTKYIGRLSPMIFPDSCVVNCHRHEWYTRGAEGGSKIIASPGCLCKNHIVRTVKQMTFLDGSPQVKTTLPVGHPKYSKQQQILEYWERGFLVVEVRADGSCNINPCKIVEVGSDPNDQTYYASFLNKIYTAEGVKEPNKKIFVNGDLHCTRHDPKVLDIQEQFCHDYQPDVHVNVGDLMDNRPLNHHVMAKTGGPMNFDFIQSTAHSKFVMERMLKWAKSSHFIVGNHERFVYDFTERYPQLKKMFEVEALLNTKKLGVQVTQLKKTLKIGSASFIHGDQKLYGQTGPTRLDKVVASYGKNCMMGNVHFPAVRTGCYSVGFSGLYDQEYNEVEVTQWLHGFGYCNIYKNMCFMSLVSIVNYTCTVGGKTYRSKKPSNWDLPEYQFALSFAFEK